MLETRSRLSEELTRRLTRWRNTAVPIVQAALAAGLSWLVAVHIVDHRAPFFAPVAAVVCLGITLGQRLRRVITVPRALPGFSSSIRIRFAAAWRDWASHSSGPATRPRYPSRHERS